MILIGAFLILLPIFGCAQTTLATTTSTFTSSTTSTSASTTSSTTSTPVSSQSTSTTSGTKIPATSIVWITETFWISSTAWISSTSSPTPTEAIVTVTTYPTFTAYTTDVGVDVTVSGLELSYAEEYVDATTTLATGTAVTLNPMPTETKWNMKGSSMCKHLSEHCQDAAQAYANNPDRIYTQYTSYWNQSGSLGMGAAKNTYGCAAMFKCENGYGNGMSGSQIYEMNNALVAHGINQCGSIYYDNDCHLTLNYCFSCSSANN